MRRLVLAACGIAALPFVCLPVSAEPITSDWIDQAAPYTKPALSAGPRQREPSAEEAAKIDPQDLVTTGPRKKEKNGRAAAVIRKTSSSKPDGDESEPEIPWELIELALQQQNQAKSSHRESEITISREYQQLVIDSLPDFALDIAYAQPTGSIPVLDFLRAQTSSLSVEIATFTSDIAIQDDTIAMASNGNLDSDDTVGEARPHKEGTKLPSLLKQLFFWGLGLLVFYTFVEAVFTKLLRRDEQGLANAQRGGDGQAGRPTRRRRFGRTRRRHSSA